MFMRRMSLSRVTKTSKAAISLHRVFHAARAYYQPTYMARCLLSCCTVYSKCRAHEHLQKTVISGAIYVPPRESRHSGSLLL